MKLERFASLIEPLTAEEFFNTVDGKTPRHFPGDPTRHQSLFDWAGLNCFLNRNLKHLQHPVLRLAKGGMIVPPREITDEVTTARRGTFQRFSQTKIEQKLSEGATLIANGIDDFDDNLGELRDTLASELGERVQINAYYSPGGIEGFDPHYDTHDIFVLQVEGSKEWQFFGETLKFPLECQPSSASDCPSEILETLTMRKGDVLYVPRGHWHSVVANAEPSLHLSVGIYHRTRVDLLRHLFNSAAECPEMRMNAASPVSQINLSDSLAEIRTFIENTLRSEMEINSNYRKFTNKPKADGFHLPLIGI